MSAAVRLVDPPRAVPWGLRLAVVARYEKGTLQLLPAVMLILLAIPVPPALRGVMLLIGALLFADSFRSMVHARVRARSILRLMSDGVQGIGRVVSCHPAWDEDSKEMPYGTFLSNWMVNTSQSQMGKAAGCFGAAVLLVFGVPLGLAATFAIIVMIKMGGQDTELLRLLGLWLAVLAFTAVVGVWLYRLNRDAVIDEIGRVAGEGADARRVIVTELEPAEQIVVSDPLPHNATAELVCQVDYLVAGEVRRGEGNVPLCDRLDRQALEPLLYNAAAAKQVLFMVGLPKEAIVGADRQWQEVSAAPRIALLSFTGLFAVASLAGLAIHLPWVFSFAPSADDLTELVKAIRSQP
jgi:hypothetical protein